MIHFLFLLWMNLSVIVDTNSVLDSEKSGGNCHMLLTSLFLCAEVSEKFQ